MLGGGKVIELHQMRARGMSIREIARQTGHDRNTVRKYLRSGEPPRMKPRPLRSSKLEPFKEHVRARMAEGLVNANRLLAELRTFGYTGGKTVLKDFMKPLRPLTKAKAVVRFETRPGEQAQVDFGVFRYRDGDKSVAIFAFVMVLSYSRALYVEFCERQDLSSLIRCHAHAFEFLGGMTGEILYDNLKPVVQGRDGQGYPIWNRRFEDFAWTIGFRPRACKPYRAQTKGRVERAIRYLRENFWPARSMTGLDDLNGQVRAWCAGVANQRIHGTTGRQPAEMQAEERLAPPPDPAKIVPFILEERPVSRDGLVSFGGSRYGVPGHLVGKVVDVREAGGHVEILFQGLRVALLPKALLRGTTVSLPGQWDGVPTGVPKPKRPAAVLRLPEPEVETRPLLVYERLAGGRR